jgi:hypothetical protein
MFLHDFLIGETRSAYPKPSQPMPITLIFGVGISPAIVPSSFHLVESHHLLNLDNRNMMTTTANINPIYTMICLPTSPKKSSRIGCISVAVY